MNDEIVARRSFLKTAASGVLGSAGLLAGLSEGAFGLTPNDPRVVHEVAGPGELFGQEAEAKPKYSIKFAVCGMSHDHIFGMAGAPRCRTGSRRLEGVVIAAPSGTRSQRASQGSGVNRRRCRPAR